MTNARKKTGKYVEIASLGITSKTAKDTTSAPDATGHPGRSHGSKSKQPRVEYESKLPRMSKNTWWGEERREGGVGVKCVTRATLSHIMINTK